MDKRLACNCLNYCMLAKAKERSCFCSCCVYARACMHAFDCRINKISCSNESNSRLPTQLSNLSNQQKWL